MGNKTVFFLPVRRESDKKSRRILFLKSCTASSPSSEPVEDEESVEVVEAASASEEEEGKSAYPSGHVAAGCLLSSSPTRKRAVGQGTPANLSSWDVCRKSLTK